MTGTRTRTRRPDERTRGFRRQMEVLPVFCLAFLAGAAEAMPQTVTRVADRAELGEGRIWTFATVDSDGNPTSIGARFDAAIVDRPPGEPDGTAPCFDGDGDGAMDPRSECFVMLRRDLSLPQAAAPFQWLQFNWNPEGHPPPAPPAYEPPHFDFHFYLVPTARVEELRPGTCGFMMDCDVFERAVVPVPAIFMPEDYVGVGAAAAEEGNHLLDLGSPELADPPAPFTHTFIYGSFDGHIIFYEPMISLAYLRTQPSECFPLKLPEAWEIGGAYPTEYCIRYMAREDEYTVSLEGFVHRDGG